LIKLILGNVGSGKTALAVREMYHNKFNRKTYTNIKTPLKNAVQIDPSMIIDKQVVDHKKNRKTGEIEAIYKKTLNIDFWKNIKEPINVILDEAHSIVNSRRSMSSVNIILTDWLSLIRRILGQTESGYGELVFITQLPKRIDVIARDMATAIQYCVMHYSKTCGDCGFGWIENSEQPEASATCLSCRSMSVKKSGFTVEVWSFQNMDSFTQWSEYGRDTFYNHYYVRDIAKYFDLYDTLQWDNLFSTNY